MNLGLFPGNEFSVVPDLLRCLNRHLGLLLPDMPNSA
jgi:hypothetical protein